MRCRECNVDLPETYTTCPLCGTKASADPAVIKDIRVAEYPKLAPQPFKKDMFRVFVCIWSAISVLCIILCKIGLISQMLTAGIVCTIALVWTLIGRPVYVKQLYAGNFIVMNWWPLALFSVAISKIQYGSILAALICYLPMCSIAVLVALTVLILVKPKNAKRAAAYPVLFIILSVIAGIVTAVKGNHMPLLWLAVIVLCVCIIALLLFMNPKATKEEIKAKFSIQRGIGKIKKTEK